MTAPDASASAVSSLSAPRGPLGKETVFQGKKQVEAGEFDKLVRQASDLKPPAVPAKTAGVSYNSRVDGGAGRMAGAETAAAKTAAETSSTANAGADGEARAGGFLAFIKTVIDIVNPLQHIPVISTIYRHLTGDEISPMARIAGGALYGGPVGAASGVANVMVAQSTGRDIGQNIMAFAGGGATGAGVSGTMLAYRDGTAVRTGGDDSLPHKNNNTDAAPPTRLAAASPQDSRTVLAPTAYRTGLAGTDRGNKEPASHDKSYTGPVHSQQKNGPIVTAGTTPAATSAVTSTAVADGAGQGKPDVLLVDSTPILQSQDAPAGKARRASPPGQIATKHLAELDRATVPSRMMAGLEKYAEMRRASPGASLTAVY